MNMHRSKVGVLAVLLTACLHAGAASPTLSDFIEGATEALRRQAEDESRLQRSLEVERERYRLQMELEVQRERLRIEREQAQERQRQIELRKQEELRQAEQRKQEEARRLEQARKEQEARKTGVTGSGYFVSDDGHIVTNNHVIDDYNSVSVRLLSGQIYPATVVARSAQSDLALLKIQAKTVGLKLKQSTADIKGEDVYAVGYPMPNIQGQESKITNGIISSLTGLANEADWMQVSAPIQSGNSGGPLVLKNGEVVGTVVASVNAAKILKIAGSIPQNVNYAIKAEVVRSFLERAGVAAKAALPKSSPIKRVDESTVMVLARDETTPLTESAKNEKREISKASPLPAQKDSGSLNNRKINKELDQNILNLARDGNAIAQLKVAEFYMDRREFVEAHFWAEEANKSGNQDAVRLMAFLHLSGYEKPNHIRKALHYLWGCSYKGDSLCMFAIGKMLAKNELGPPERVEEGFLLIKRSASLGYKPAIDYLNNIDSDYEY